MFVTPSLSGGGAEKNLVNIINSLDDSKFSITLVVFYGNDNYLPLIEKKVEVRKLEVRSVKAGVLKLRSILDKVRPEIVFTSAEHILFFLSLYKIFRGKFKLIYRLPTLPSNKLYKGLKGKIIASFTKSILKWSDFIICQTNEMKSEVHKYYNIEDDKVYFIKNMVNIEQILKYSNEYIPEFSANKTNIVAAGSLYSAKGFDILIKAIANLIKQNRNIKVYILGDETVEKGYREYLENLIESLHVSEYISLLGFVKNPYPYYKSADIFVLSSIKEGFPNVVLEALVLGTPVVATNCINFEGIIDSSNGLIVEKGNIESLSVGLQEIKVDTQFSVTLKNFDYSEWFQKILLV